jgi:hypothetical protein
MTTILERKLKGCGVFSLYRSQRAFLSDGVHSTLSRVSSFPFAFHLRREDHRLHERVIVRGVRRVNPNPPEIGASQETAGRFRLETMSAESRTQGLSRRIKKDRCVRTLPVYILLESK